MKPSRRDSSRRILNRAYNPVVRVVARLPATVNRKLLIAFVGIVVLLVTVGVLGLRVLGDANDRVAALGKLQQRTAAYQVFQTDAAELRLLFGLRAGGSDIYVFSGGNPTAQPGNVAAIDGAIESTLTRLVPLTDVTSLGFTPPSKDVPILDAIHSDSSRLAGVMSLVVNLDLAGQTTQGQQIQSEQGEVLANDLQNRTLKLVAATSRDTTSLIALNTSSYSDSQHLFIGVAVGSVEAFSEAIDAAAGDEFVEEWPQSGERIRGKATAKRINEGYSAATGTTPSMRLRRIVGEGDVQVVEATIDYGDGTPVNYIGIAEFKGGKLTKITEYFASPFEAPAWRADFVERMDPVGVH